MESQNTVGEDDSKKEQLLISFDEEKTTSNNDVEAKGTLIEASANDELLVTTIELNEPSDNLVEIEDNIVDSSSKTEEKKDIEKDIFGNESSLIEQREDEKPESVEAKTDHTEPSLEPDKNSDTLYNISTQNPQSVSNNLESPIEGQVVESKHHELENQIEELKKKIAKEQLKSEQQIKNIKEENSMLKEQINQYTEDLLTTQTKYENCYVKADKFEKDLKSEKAEHEELKKIYNELKSKMGAAMNSANNSDMLNIELADCQRVASSLKEQLSKATQEKTQMVEIIAKLKKKIEENGNLETKILKLKQLVRASRQDLGKAQDEVKEKEKIITDLNENILKEWENKYIEVTVLLDQEREKLKTLERNAKELKEKSERIENDMSEVHSGHETTIQQLKQNEFTAKTELENVKDEFQKYKTRVHSVLKQKQTNTPEMSPALTRQDTSMKQKLIENNAEISKLKTKILKIEEKGQLLDEENSYLAKTIDDNKSKAQTEKDVLENKINDLKFELKNLKSEKDKIEEKMSIKYKDTDMNSESLKKNIEIKQEEINSLLQEIQSLKSEKQDLEKTMANIETKLLDEIQKNSCKEEIRTPMNQIMRKSSDDFPKLNSTNSALENTMLTKILTFNDWQQEQESNTNSGQAEEPGTDLDLNLVTSKGNLANKSDEKVTERLNGEIKNLQKEIEELHLLISESEESIAKHEDQQNLLKTEIRRLEAHASRNERFNLEYLKNILYSFLEAKSPEDRKPLLLVFGQMLHFNEDEMQQLTKSYAEYEKGLKSVSPSGWNFFNSS